MTKEVPILFPLIILFIIIIIFIQVISNYYKDKRHIKYDKSIVRPSYGDEFYNYRSGSGLKKEDDTIINDNIQEVVIEGFPFNTSSEAILETHSICPVMGGETSITSCIHYPNNSIEGLPGPIDSGFLVSVCCCDCVSEIQTSLTTGSGIYDIIYEGDRYILTKNGKKTQVLLECNPTNLGIITNLVETTLGNC